MTLALFLLAVCGGALNAVGGGATFVVFPALVFAGVPALQANVTATVGLWPASVATAIVFRGSLGPAKGHVGPLVVASVVGASAGAGLLLVTPSGAFTRMVPVLLLGATLVFTFGEPIARRFAGRGGPGVARGAWAPVVAAQLVIAAYGGYFGAGVGILMLASLTLLGWGDVHAVNAVRSLLVMVINLVGVAIFVCAAAVAWRAAAVVAVGAVAGALGGAAIVRRAHGRHVRPVIVAVAWGMTLYFVFVRPL